MAWPVLAGLIGATGGVLLARHWAMAVICILLVYVCVAGLLIAQPLPPEVATGFAPWLLPLVEVVAGLVVSGILLLTGLTFGEPPDEEEIDEFGRLELRRVARLAARSVTRAEWSDYLLPGAAVAVALVATALLPHLYPVVHAGANGRAASEYGWTWLVLAGLLQLMISQHLLKLGCGMLLVGLGLELFYLDWTQQVALPVLALFQVALIALALIVAYLCGLQYGRLGSLDLGDIPSGESGR